MNELRQLPNIGAVLERLLVQAGLDTPEKLRAAGTREAFIRIRELDPTACHAKLYGLQGAIDGIRWHDLPAETKLELNKFFKTL